MTFANKFKNERNARMFHLPEACNIFLECTYVLEQAFGGRDISFFNRNIGCYKTDTDKQEQSYSFTISKVKFKSRQNQ